MGSKDILEKGAGLQVIKTADLFPDKSNQLERNPKENQNAKVSSPLIHITKAVKETAVLAGIIPNAYIDCDFNIEQITINQTLQAKATARKFKCINFDSYKEVTEGIISTIIANKLPDRSYIIGAPNGFGKTSFVNSCILKLFALNRMCVPYISLTELAQVRLTNEQRIAEGILSDRYYMGSYKNAHLGEDYRNKLYSDIDKETYVKMPIHIIDKFSWSEYINSDILFCYFTDVRSRVIESEILKTVVNIRGTKGLPTIAMISTSLNPYKNDPKLAEMVWNEILDTNGTMPGYDRFQHVSCYKDYNAPLIKRT